MATREIRNAYDLRDAYQETHPDGHFFDPETLMFWGIKMEEIELKPEPVLVKRFGGRGERLCWAITQYEHKFPTGMRVKESYFDCETFGLVIPEC